MAGVVFFAAALIGPATLVPASPSWAPDAGFAPVLVAEQPAIGFAHFVSEPGGGIVACGSFTHLDGVSAAALVRLDANGQRVPGFGNFMNLGAGAIQSIAPLDGGGMLVLYRPGGGQSTADLEVVRLRADGSLDASLGAVRGGSEARFSRLPDGRVLLWGFFTEFAGLARTSLVRFSAAGGFEADWSPVVASHLLRVTAVTGGSDGSVYASGYAAVGGNDETHLVRIEPDGTVGVRYAIAPGITYQHLAVQSGSRLLAANRDRSPLFHVRIDPRTGSLLYRLGITRFRADGSSDASFGASLPIAEDSEGMAVLPDDRIVVQTIGAEDTDAGHRTVLVLSADGTPLLDVRDRLGRERDAFLLGVETGGTLLLRHGLATGNLTFTVTSPSVGTAPAAAQPASLLDQRISRLDPNATGSRRLAIGLTTRFPGAIHSMLRDQQGRIVVAGVFNQIAGASRPGVARFLPDGTLDPAFAPTDTTLGYPAVELVAPDNGVIVRSTYLSRGGDGFYTQPSRFVRLRPDGSVDNAFLLPAELLVPEKQLRWHLASSPGGYLVSYFTPDSNAGENLRLAWLDTSGRIEKILLTRFSFGPSAWILGQFVGGGASTASSGAFANPLVAVEQLKDGHLLVSGAFESVNGAARPWVVKLLADGALDPAYAPAYAPGEDPGYVRVFKDGSAQVWLVDTSRGVEETTRVRLRPDGSRDPAFGVLRGAAAQLPTDPATGLSDANLPLTASIGGATYSSLRNHLYAADGSLWVIATAAPSGPVALTARQVPLRFTALRAAVITIPPQDTSVVAGESATLHVTVGTDAAATYQWFQDGAALVGATSSTLQLDSVTAAQAGRYTVRVQIGGVTLESEAATVTVAPNDARVVNFSTRGQLAPGRPQIAGLVVERGSARPVLVRATGLGLAPYIHASLAADPVLSLHRGSAILGEDRGGILRPEIAAVAQQLGAFEIVRQLVIAPNANHGSALALPLESGVHTAMTSAADGRAGLALLECYTEPREDAARVTNFSIRALAGEGAGTLTVGFVIAGTGPVPVLVRAVGPGLAPFGVSNFAADPGLTVRRSVLRRIVSANDDWAGDPRTSAAIDAAGAFPLDPAGRDAALRLDLVPGPYTVTVTADAEGEVLLEVYVL